MLDVLHRGVRRIFIWELLCSLDNDHAVFALRCRKLSARPSADSVQDLLDLVIGDVGTLANTVSDF